MASAAVLAQAQALLGANEVVLNDDDDVRQISEDRIKRLEGKSVVKNEAAPENQEHRYDKAGLLRKLGEIRYKAAAGGDGRIPWVETLSLTAKDDEHRGIEETGVTEDIRREGAFKNQSLELAKEGYRRLRVMRIPANRPDDFMAEMMKDDSQMHKVSSWCFFNLSIYFYLDDDEDDDNVVSIRVS